MPALFSALATLYTSAAKIAAALGMTRQAYSQAAKRRRLSESKAMLAGKLIGISPAKALFLNATGKDTPAPINNPTPHPCPQILDEKKQAQSPPNNCQPTNYANLARRLFLPKSALGGVQNNGERLDRTLGYSPKMWVIFNSDFHENGYISQFGLFLARRSKDFHITGTNCFTLTFRRCVQKLVPTPTRNTKPVSSGFAVALWVRRALQQYFLEIVLLLPW